MKTSVKSALVALLVVALGWAAWAGDEEGGYVYNRGEDRFVDNVYNFLKHFSYEQYFWCETYEFTSSNNSYVDAMDIAYYSGHGNHWYIGMGPGARHGSGVRLRSAGSYGDLDLEFIVFQSCKVIPGPPDVSDWWSAWVPSGIFQGLHQAISYRTKSWSGNGISDRFGRYVRRGDAVWQAWFRAVDSERAWWRDEDYPGYASVVLYPGLDDDTYYSYGADPPAGHGSLRIYYEH
jgi:hypothetical protein